MGHSGEELHNPITGERVVFVRTAADTGGELFEGEHWMPPGGERQPYHVHPKQESAITVLDGLAGFKIDGRERGAGPGDLLLTPPGLPHQIWNEGEGTLHFRFEYRPALPETELFFENFFGLARDGKTDSHGMPGLLQLAVMVPAYSDYIRLASPPWWVQRALFGALRPVARLAGRQASYPSYSEPAREREAAVNY